MHSFRINVILLCVVISSAQNAQILIVSPSLQRSNQVWNIALAIGLATKGHNVTMLTPSLPHIRKTQNENITYFILEGADKLLRYKSTSRLNPTSHNLDMNDIKTIRKRNDDFSNVISNYFLRTSGLRTFLDYASAHTTFDVILWDLENSERLYPLIPWLHHPPVIILSPQGFQPYLDWIFGTSWKTYLPLPGLPYNKDMSFLRRFLNALTIKFLHFQKYDMHYTHDANEIEIFRGRGNFTKADVISLEEKFVLALVNSDLETDYARDIAQNIILVGGLHLDIAEKYKTKFDRQTNDTKLIYVSVQDDQLEIQQIQGMADCFGSLDEYKIYWRIPNVKGKILRPRNIVFNETFNQIKILSNGNLKLFITSGNLLSLQEAVYFGVPILAIPSTHAQSNFVQKFPIETAAANAINEKYLCMKIRRILTDEDYLENAKMLAWRINDKLVPPMEKAIYWIEYVIRHRSGKHLEPLTRRMNYYEAENLDFLLIVVIMFLVLPIYFMYKFMKFILTSLELRTIDNARQFQDEERLIV